MITQSELFVPKFNYPLFASAWKSGAGALYLLNTVAGTVETSELKVPPQMRSVQVGSMLGALPALAAHGMMIQSPLHELGPTEPTIEVTWFWPVVCPLRLNERDLLLTATHTEQGDG